MLCTFQTTCTLLINARINQHASITVMCYKNGVPYYQVKSGYAPDDLHALLPVNYNAKPMTYCYLKQAPVTL